MRVILVSFLLFGMAWADLTCECGKRNAGRIVGGKETKKNEYPWMVAMQMVRDAFTYCGGTIVTPRHVVSAAHCVTGRNINELILVVGAHDVNDFNDKTAVIHGVREAILHDKADIALLVTNSEIQFNEFVGPACMPDREMTEAKLTGQNVKAMGWGKYDPKKSTIDKIWILREVDLQIIAPSNCNEGSSVSTICAYSPGKDTCDGDSGGPLVWLDPEVNSFTFVGVVSSGPEDCGNSRKPSNNVNVMHYKNWINNKISSTVEDVWTCENDIIY